MRTVLEVLAVVLAPALYGLLVSGFFQWLHARGQAAKAAAPNVGGSKGDGGNGDAAEDVE